MVAGLESVWKYLEKGHLRYFESKELKFLINICTGYWTQLQDCKVYCCKVRTEGSKKAGPQEEKMTERGTDSMAMPKFCKV